MKFDGPKQVNLGCVATHSKAPCIHFLNGNSKQSKTNTITVVCRFYQRGMC